MHFQDSPWMKEIVKLDELVLEFFPETEQRMIEWLRITPSSLPHPVPAYMFQLRDDTSRRLHALQEQLASEGYLVIARKRAQFGGFLVQLRIIPEFFIKKKQESPRERLLKLGLFVATLLSLLWVGWINGTTYAELAHVGSTFDIFLLALSYGVGLLLAVGIHEMGHMFLAMRHGHPPNYPVFIPLPFGFGTLGAVIMQKEPFKTRNELFDISISGPLLGLIPSVIFSIWGLFLSIPINETVLSGINLGTWEFIQGYRIPLFEMLAFLIKPGVSPSESLLLHPLALAGYIGLLVTALNLVPVGQLDGGHVARSLVSTEQQHRTITYIAAIILILLGFWFFALIILYLYMRTGHPGPLDDVTELTRGRRIIGGLTVALWFLLLPIPEFLVQQILLFL